MLSQLSNCFYKRTTGSLKQKKVHSNNSAKVKTVSQDGGSREVNTVPHGVSEVNTVLQSDAEMLDKLTDELSAEKNMKGVFNKIILLRIIILTCICS